VLGEKGDAQTPAPGHLSPVHFLQPREDTQHRGLARAVAADQPEPRPGVHLHLQPSEHGASPIELFHGTELDQGHARLALIFIRPMMAPLEERRITQLDDFRPLTTGRPSLDI
jgi:hypothetical protein